MGDTPDFGSAGLGETGSAFEDAKAFNQGKGRLLAAMIAMVVAALGGFGFYLVQDQPNPYAELGKQVNRLRSAGFDQFWTCALPNTNPADLKNNEDLLGELHGRGAAAGRYAAHLQNECAPPLRDVATRLRALLPPEDAAVHVKAMADAASKIELGVTTYAGHLRALEGPYARDAATPELEGLVRGWYEFRKAHAELNRLVKTRLGR